MKNNNKEVSKILKLINLDKSDLDFIIKSLDDTKLKFQNYNEYPDLEFKAKRLEYVENLIKKISEIKNINFIHNE